MRSRRHWGGASLGLKLAAAAGLVFLHLPVWVIVLYAFTTEDRTYAFPPPGLTLHWFEAAFARDDIWAGDAAVAHGGERRDAWWRWCSARWRPSRSRAAASAPRSRSRCSSCCRSRCRASSRAWRSWPESRSVGLTPGFWTIVAGHATFCLVIVYNNVIARLRRIPPSWVEASMDLGADGWQTFRYVLLPQIATALLAGGMLAFALSFDEIIVTLFTAGHERTLPIWFYNELFRPRERPITNVVAVIVILVTLGPILLAYYLTRPDEHASGN